MLVNIVPLPDYNPVTIVIRLDTTIEVCICPQRFVSASNEVNPVSVNLSSETGEQSSVVKAT